MVKVPTSCSCLAAVVLWFVAVKDGVLGSDEFPFQEHNVDLTMTLAMIKIRTEKNLHSDFQRERHRHEPCAIFRAVWNQRVTEGPKFKVFFPTCHYYSTRATVQ